MSEAVFRSPYTEFTLIKNLILDQVMPSLTSNAWKVLCVALRYAWQSVPGSTRPTLNLAQFIAKTGISEQAAVELALKECVDAGYLTWDQTSGSPDAFVLNVDFVQAAPTPAAPKVETVAPLPPNLDAAYRSLLAFARETGATYNLELVRRAVLDNGAAAVTAWIEVGRVMTNLKPPARFKTVLERLLQGVPPLPLSMLAPEEPSDVPARPPSVSKPVAQNLSASDLWQATLNALRSQMRSSKFKFLEPTVGLALDSNVLTVEATNERVREWLETGQLAETILETFKSVAGEQMELKFVTQA